MAKFTLWEGTRSPRRDEIVEIEIEGEAAGEVKEASDLVRKQTTVYRASDGRIVIHETRLQDEETHARVFFFPSLDKAREGFGWVLEAVGLHPSRRAMIEEFEEWD